MVTNLSQITARVGLWTLLSRFAGYGRDMVMAHLLGASWVVEAFQVAFSFPNLFRNLFGEGAINAALIPRYAAIESAQGSMAARQFFGDVVLVIGGLMLLFALLSYVWMPEIIAVLAWGFSTEKQLLTVEIARLCLPFLPCIILVALVGGVLNHRGYFTLPAVIPIVLNTIMLLTLLSGLYHDLPFDIRLLAYAVTSAGFVQLGLCLLFAWRHNILPHFAHRFGAKAMQHFLLLLLPGVMSGMFLQVNFLTNRAFASNLGEGSIAWLFYAERLFSLPLALIGISLGVALLPLLSQAVSNHDHQRSKSLAQQALKAALFWSLPATIGIILCAEWIIALLFERGAFGAHDTLQTARALQMLALGLPAYILVKVLQPLFFARQNTRTPMIISMSIMGLNIFFSLMLMPILAHVGLALAAAISGWMQVIVLYQQLQHHRPTFTHLGKFTMGVVTACVLMASLIGGAQWIVIRQQWINGGLSLTLALVGVILLAVVVYLVAAQRLTGYKWYAFRHEAEHFQE